MTKSKLSKSTRCHIRRQKAEIRKKTRDPEEQKAAIAKLYEKVGAKPKAEKKK